jgi:hypothetical protein
MIVVAYTFGHDAFATTGNQTRDFNSPETSDDTIPNWATIISAGANIAAVISLAFTIIKMRRGTKSSKGIS